MPYSVHEDRTPNFNSRQMIKISVRKAILLILTVTGLAGFTGSLSAQEALSVSRSYRSLAMGHTGIASANDSAALFYNPAILANVKGWWLDYSAWTLETSDGFTATEYTPMMVSPVFPYIKSDGIITVIKAPFCPRITLISGVMPG